MSGHPFNLDLTTPAKRSRHEEDTPLTSGRYCIRTPRPSFRVRKPLVAVPLDSHAVRTKSAGLETSGDDPGLIGHVLGQVEA